MNKENVKSENSKLPILDVCDIDFRFKIEADKSLIYDRKTDKDICMYFDEQTRDWLLDLFNTYVE